MDRLKSLKLEVEDANSRRRYAQAYFGIPEPVEKPTRIEMLAKHQQAAPGRARCTCGEDFGFEVEMIWRETQTHIRELDRYQKERLAEHQLEMLEGL